MHETFYIVNVSDENSFLNFTIKRIHVIIETYLKSTF